MSFTCKRCNESFLQKISLIKHLKKYASCPIINIEIDREEYLKELVLIKKKSFPCKYCDKYFTQSNNRYVHQQNCKKTVNISTFNSISDDDDDLKNIDYDSQDKKQLVDIISQLRQENKLLRKQSTINNTTNNIENTIIINNYGFENHTHIDWVKHFIDVDLPQLLKDIHYHKDAPENNNLRLRYDSGADYLEKRLYNRWVKVELNGIHQVIIDKARLLEKVPKTHELIKNGICGEHEVQDLLDELQHIKNAAKKQEYNTMYSDFELRIHNETQKSIARDPNSKAVFVVIKSNPGSNVASDYESS